MANAQNKKEQLLSGLLALFIFVVPSNLFYRLDNSWAYINGLLVDYLIPKIYLTDLLMIAIIMISIVMYGLPKIKLPNKLTIFGLAGAVLIVTIIGRQFLSLVPQVSIFFLGKLILVSAFGWWLWHHRQLLKQPLVTAALFVTILFQAGLGLYQFYQQQSLVGYYLLGEPSLTYQVGLATGTWAGAELIQPYATTAHPNILAGVVVIYWLLIAIGSKPKHWSELLVVSATGVLIVWTIILTQSWSAALALALGLLSIWSKKASWVIGLGVLSFVTVPIGLWVASHQLESPSIIRRVQLTDAGLRMFHRFPLVGTGFNMYTTWLEIVSRSPELVRFVQPAHHVGILWLAETGLAGVALIIWAGAWLKQHLSHNSWLLLLTKVAILLPIAGLDHYLFSLQTGWLLVLLWLVWPLKLLDQR